MITKETQKYMLQIQEDIKHVTTRDLIDTTKK